MRTDAAMQEPLDYESKQNKAASGRWAAIVGFLAMFFGTLFLLKLLGWCLAMI